MIRGLIRVAHEQIPDFVKFLGSIGYTTFAAITAQQENIAWYAQVFMWMTAGILSLVTTVSVIIKTLRGKRED